jgi:hypothetical protein
MVGLLVWGAGVDRTNAACHLALRRHGGHGVGDIVQYCHDRGHGQATGKVETA